MQLRRKTRRALHWQCHSTDRGPRWRRHSRGSHGVRNGLPGLPCNVRRHELKMWRAHGPSRCQGCLEPSGERPAPVAAPRRILGRVHGLSVGRQRALLKQWKVPSARPAICRSALGTH